MLVLSFYILSSILINNSLNEIRSYLLLTKHYTLNLLTAPIVGERELSGISDTARYPFIPPCIISGRNQYNYTLQLYYIYT